MKISVVIPAYNAAPFIAKTIACARAQTLAPIEIIVVDDGSRDATSAIARAAGATVISQMNAGVCAARNAGIMAATGDWIALLDQDDVWLPQKLERQAAAVAQSPGAAFIASDFQRLRGTTLAPLSILSEPGYQLDAMTVEPLDDTVRLYPRAGEEILRVGFMLFPSSMLIRRDVLISAGMFRVDQRLCEDVECFLRVLRLTPLVIVHEVLWHWLEHDDNNSRNTIGIAEGWLKLERFVQDDPVMYPARTLEALQPRIAAVRLHLISEYADLGDFKSARRVARAARRAGNLTPSAAALAVAVELPPSVWTFFRRGKIALRSLLA